MRRDGTLARYVLEPYAFLERFAMNASAYRSSDAVVRERIEVLRAARSDPAYEADFALARGVAASRIARAFAGSVGTLCGVGVFAFALASFEACGGRGPLCEGQLCEGAEIALLGGWLVALMVGMVAFVGAHSTLRSDPNEASVDAGDLWTELATLERHDPLREMREVARRWEFAAVATPLTAISLLAPLTLHWLVDVLFLGGASSDNGFRTNWIPASAIIVGHAHLALVIACVWWARSLRRREAVEARLAINRSWGTAMAVTVATAAVPGIALLAIPPILVALTGLVFVPWMFRATASVLMREREMLGTQ
jgi:hypothetical protein